MHAYSMGKVITISDEAYTLLSRQKEPKDSFSKVIMRTFGEQSKKSILDLAGAWKGSPEVADIMKKVYTQRKQLKLRDVALG